MVIAFIVHTQNAQEYTCNTLIIPYTYLGCNRWSGTVLGRSVFLDELDIGLADICEAGRDVFDAGLDLAFDILEAGREFDFLCPNGSSAPIFSMRLRYFFSPSFNSLKLRN